MSMTRNDALTQLAHGLRKFDGWTAAQVLDSKWPGLLGLHMADLAYFRARAPLPAQQVAQSCLGRSRMSPLGDPPLAARMGRPPGSKLPPEQRKEPVVRARVTQAQAEKFTLLGGAEWLRRTIDEAQLP